MTLPRPNPDSGEHAALALDSPLGWGWYVTDGEYRAPPHVALIARYWLDAAINGARVIVTTGPRHGKSMTVARMGPGWLLGRRPETRVVCASHTARLAKIHSRQTRRDFERHGERVFGLRVDRTSRAAEQWQVEGHDGGYRAVGVGGSLTGEGTDLLVIDDYCPDAEAALSQVQRDATWDWWLTVASTRLEPGAGAVIMATRWHEDDLIGRVLQHEPGRWKVLRIPTLSEGDGDPLGRPAGAPLWPERYPLDALHAIRERQGAYWWSAMYQGMPVPEGGGIFRAAWFDVRRWRWEGQRIQVGETRYAPTDLAPWIVVDLATSLKESADYTAIGCFGRTRDGHVVMLDMDRRRMESPEIRPAMRRMMERWGARVAWVEDAGQQALFIQECRREGMPVRAYGRKKEHALTLPRDKAATYHEAAPFCEAGRCWLPLQAPWLADFEAELMRVPAAANDDQADVFSAAVLMVREGVVGRYAYAAPAPRNGSPTAKDWPADPRLAGPLHVGERAGRVLEW